MVSPEARSDDEITARAVQGVALVGLRGLVIRAGSARSSTAPTCSSC